MKILSFIPGGPLIPGPFNPSRDAAFLQAIAQQILQNAASHYSCCPECTHEQSRPSRFQVHSFSVGPEDVAAIDEALQRL